MLKETFIICSIIKSQHPKINLTLINLSDFAEHVFCKDVEINQIGDYKIFKCVTDQNSLEILRENMKKMETEQRQTKPKNVIFILKCHFFHWCKNNQTF